MNKKKYVLWVVHTEGSTSMLIDYFNKCDYSKRGQGFKILDDYLEEKYVKKKGIKKSIGEMHIEGVLKAIEIALKAGMTVVSEASTRKLIRMAEERGIKGNILFMERENAKKGDEDSLRLLAKKAAKDFLKLLEDNGIKNFEVIFAGHWAEQCVHDRAWWLIRRGFRPYLLVGTPTIYCWGEEGVVRCIRRSYFKNRLITLLELGKL